MEVIQFTKLPLLYYTIFPDLCQMETDNFAKNHQQNSCGL